MQENPNIPALPAIKHHSPPAVKIALFRSLFRGREDVHPRRFENQRTGRAGYAPACGNEWVRGICEKPRIKCTDCPHRAFLAVTDEVIRWHLSGKDSHGKDFVAGVYPMLADEACFFLAEDLSKHLDATLDAILRAVAQRRRSSGQAPATDRRTGDLVPENEWRS